MQPSSLLRKLSITPRLLLITLLLLGCFLSLAILVVRNVNQGFQASQNIYQHPFTVSNAAHRSNELAMAFQQQLSNTLYRTAHPSVQTLNPNGLDIKALSQALSEQQDRIKTYYLGPRTDLELAANAQARWLASLPELIQLIESKAVADAQYQLHTQVEQQIEAFIASNDRFVHYASNKADQFLSDAMQQQQQSIKNLKLWFALSLIFAAVIVSLLIKSIVLPLNALVRRAEKLGEGELKRVEDDRGNDEINSLHLALNQMVIQLEQLVQALKDRNQDLDTSNLQLTESLALLESSKDQLVQSEKMAALGELVAGVAHEINSPLGVAVTGISLISEETAKLESALQQQTLTKARMESYLQNLHECLSLTTKNQQKAVDLIANFKMIAVDQSSGEKRRINLREYIEEAVKLLHPIYRKCDLQIQITGDQPQLDTEPGAWNQIITNLLTNSITHGFSGCARKGMVQIQIKENHQQILISYKDNGRGMSSDEQAKVFDPFFTTRRGDGGSGLGMSIVYNLVKTRLAGEISCEASNEGVHFNLSVPREIPSE